MNKLIKDLSGGDLRSDGKADDVAQLVIKHPGLLPDLMEGLESESKAIRMRTAHALEVISRNNAGLLEAFSGRLIECAREDELPETRWHLAQVFGNLSLSGKEIKALLPVLYEFLASGTPLVKSWTIVGLASIAKSHTGCKKEIFEKISGLKNDKSPAVRKRVEQALKPKP